MKNKYTPNQLHLGTNDGISTGGVLTYTINGPFDNYRNFIEKLRNRLVREYSLTCDDPDSGANARVRNKYNTIKRAAFNRYLREIKK